MILYNVYPCNNYYFKWYSNNACLKKVKKFVRFFNDFLLALHIFKICKS